MAEKAMRHGRSNKRSGPRVEVTVKIILAPGRRLQLSGRLTAEQAERLLGVLPEGALDRYFDEAANAARPQLEELAERLRHEEGAR